MSSVSQKPDKTMDLLKKLLNVFWLRPETALFRAIDLMQLSHYEFTKPMLDLACGNGIFSFIAMGGEFGLSFDMFRAVKESGEFFSGEDIYNSVNELIGDYPLRMEMSRRPREIIDGLGADRVVGIILNELGGDR